jgi:putative addiction module component (TIGR02574 family)
MSLTSIQEEIVRLSSAERAKVIDILWESLDEERVKEIEAKWAAESESRTDAVDRGELQTLDGPSALQDLRSSLLPDVKISSKRSCPADARSMATSLRFPAGGEYIGVATTPDGAFQILWSDNRTAAYQLRMTTVKVPGTPLN